MRPRDAKTSKDRCALVEDNFPRDPDEWGILLDDDHVSIHMPGGGGWVEIPREQWDALVDWYMRDQPKRSS